uniref:Coiled-coil domain containing 28B n=3 Tax=Timema TaxID=61471 RepID=A0A7R9AP36_TIMSH|nr:unnamed protein product [Timema douglasi]CAD7257360.1 unnamed protein product [Timema shepardi]CAD7396514.1 unnamed protein product [Timema poppensis]
MAEGLEECELQQLVPADDDPRHTGSKSGEVTPPVPGVSKVTQTSPLSPVSNKVSSGGGSLRGATIQGSTASRTLTRITTVPIIGTSSITSPTAGSASGSQHAKFLYVNEKLPRGPSLMSDNSTKPCRINPIAARLHNTKRDVTDVRRMEEALLHLLEDFHSGKLRAFGKDCSMEQMTGIREQQERLARLHFDLGAQQELFVPLSDEGLRAGEENMQRLMESLEQLSVSIERLHSFSSDSRESSLLHDSS